MVCNDEVCMYVCMYACKGLQGFKTQVYVPRRRRPEKGMTILTNEEFEKKKKDAEDKEKARKEERAKKGLAAKAKGMVCGMLCYVMTFVCMYVCVCK